LNDITPTAFPTGRELTDEDYSDNNGTPLNSSYFNNMVTPVQRRAAELAEYVMEYCPKVLVSDCVPTDWRIGLQGTSVDLIDPGTGLPDPSYHQNPDDPDIKDATSWDIVALNYDIQRDGNDDPIDINDSPITNPTAHTDRNVVPKLDTTTGVTVPSSRINNPLIAGTTVFPPQDNAIGKPRRVAFLRDPNGFLIFDSNNNPIPLGIASTNTVQPFPYSDIYWRFPLQFRNVADIPDTIALKYASLALCNYRGQNSCPTFGTQAHLNQSNGVNGFNTPRALATEDALWYTSVSNNANPTNPSSKIYREPFPLFYRGIADPDGINIHNAVTAPKTTTYTNRSGDQVWHNGQPLLEPVVQLQATTGEPPTQPHDPPDRNHDNAGNVHWLPRPTISTDYPNTTIFNLVMATKDSPSRPHVGTHEGDIGGALSVLPRFLENWLIAPGKNDDQSVQIDGSFIQTGRSFYATAPFYQLPSTNNAANSLFVPNFPSYRTGNAGKQPAYEAPTRAWGFDVGLLSQIPDLFAQNFAIAPDEEPNLFYREVSRNDPWIQTLLCAKTVDDKYALPETERPSSCP
jgi:hypothetical protein